MTIKLIATRAYSKRATGQFLINFRPGTARQPSASDGTDVGLALLRRIAKSGGRAWIETTAGGGCGVLLKPPQPQANP
ncbi:MAG TPA: hypothetical protein PLB25_02740 [Rhodoferax sp.]|nr:hypothetical protein [Rhodoferax sp.]